MKTFINFLPKCPCPQVYQKRVKVHRKKFTEKCMKIESMIIFEKGNQTVNDMQQFRVGVSNLY